jgi:hypothetical protein
MEEKDDFEWEHAEAAAERQPGIMPLCHRHDDLQRPGLESRLPLERFPFISGAISAEIRIS